eukprot:jgi/Bigna1/128719/aug1.7_g3427
MTRGKKLRRTFFCQLEKSFAKLQVYQWNFALRHRKNAGRGFVFKESGNGAQTMVSSSAGQGMASPPASGHLIRKHPSAIGFSIKLNKGMMKKILSAEDKIRILVGSEGSGDPKLYQVFTRCPSHHDDFIEEPI